MPPIRMGGHDLAVQLHPLPFPSPRQAYARQADELLAAWRSGDTDAIEFLRHHHPRFLDERTPWRPRRHFMRGAQ